MDYNIANNMKYNVGDIVAIPSKEIGAGEIVDIVNGGEYRIEADGILYGATEDELVLVQQKEEDEVVPPEEITESVVTEGKLMQYAKEFFDKMKQGKIESKEVIEEGLKTNDLEYVVSPYVSVDEYTSKISSDNITIGLFCNEKEVAKDLLDFIEKMYFLEIRDIEIGDSLTEDNKYILFVEFDRNPQFPKVLVDVLDSINFLINKKLGDWKFITLNMKSKLPVSIEALTKYVRLVPLQDKPTEEKEVKKESVQYSKDNITRTYLDEGYITEEELSKCIDECETLNESMSLDREVLEYNFPAAEILTTEENVFIIDSGKIRKLGY